jgi:hypothetical protein
LFHGRNVLVKEEKASRKSQDEIGVLDQIDWILCVSSSSSSSVVFVPKEAEEDARRRRRCEKMGE